MASTKTKALKLVQVSWQTNFQRAKNSPFFRMLILFQLGISSLGEPRALSRNPNSQKRFFSIHRFRFQTELGGGGGGLCTLDSKLYLSTAPLHQMFSFTTEAKNGQCLMRFYVTLHFSSLHCQSHNSHLATPVDNIIKHSSVIVKWYITNVQINKDNLICQTRLAAYDS